MLGKGGKHDPLAPKGGGKGMRGKGKSGKAAHPETEAHAREIREVARGRDIVERQSVTREQRPPQFAAEDVLVVRSWMSRRPLEPTQPAAALVHFPRQWASKRGRYCRFVAPGAGAYGIVRARPTF